jgi:hypothetical protein
MPATLTPSRKPAKRTKRKKDREFFREIARISRQRVAAAAAAAREV